MFLPLPATSENAWNAMLTKGLGIHVLFLHNLVILLPQYTLLTLSWHTWPLPNFFTTFCHSLF